MLERLKDNIPTLVVIGAVIAFFGLMAYTTNQPTPSATDPEITIDEKEAADAKKKKNDQQKDYTYTAQAGDSYILLARQSVQAYARDNTVSLTKAQIIAAETTLAQQAGWPTLDITQVVILKTGDVKSAVDAAQKLSSDELAAWENYVPYVEL